MKSMGYAQNAYDDDDDDDDKEFTKRWHGAIDKPPALAYNGGILEEERLK